MKLSDLQRTCLDKMGIQWFEKRDVPTFDYLVCVNEPMSGEKQQLLDRMLIALRWMPNRCANVFTADLHTILEKSNAIQPKKRIIFSNQADLYECLHEKGSHFSTIVLPSLEKLLTDRQSKKVAWEKMQPFIES